MMLSKEGLKEKDAVETRNYSLIDRLSEAGTVAGFVAGELPSLYFAFADKPEYALSLFPLGFIGSLAGYLIGACTGYKLEQKELKKGIVHQEPTLYV